MLAILLLSGSLPILCMDAPDRMETWDGMDIDETSLTTWQAALSSLPEELKLYILSFIANADSLEAVFAELKKLSQINREFHRLVHDTTFTREVFWHFIYAHEKQISPDFFKIIVGLKERLATKQENASHVRYKDVMGRFQHELYSAIVKGDYRTVVKLVDACINVELRQNLFRAIIQGDLNAVKGYVEDGVNVNARVASRDLPAVHEFLVVKNNLLNGIIQYTPLMLAVERGDVKLVEFLLDHGVKVDAKWGSYTALTMADKIMGDIRRKEVGLLFTYPSTWRKLNTYEEIMKLLLSKGASVERLHKMQLKRIKIWG